MFQGKKIVPFRILISAICYFEAYHRESYRLCSILISPQFVRVFFFPHSFNLTARFSITLLNMPAEIALTNLVTAVFRS